MALSQLASWHQPGVQPEVWYGWITDVTPATHNLVHTLNNTDDPFDEAALLSSETTNAKGHSHL
jgi:hypothetical protein